MLNVSKKERAMSNYINLFPQLDGWLFFNTVVQQPGNTSLLTDSDNILKEYIDGSTGREYICTVAMVKEFDTEGTSEININAMENAKNFSEWIEQNNVQGVFPDFGDLCEIEKITVIDQIPRIAIDGENNSARYTVSIKLNYLERSR